jgi:hypothetical protein
MALTKVSRGLLSTGIVDNSNATAITIDSSENVGIGTSSPLQALHVNSGTGNSGAIFESTDAVSQIWIKDSNSSSTYQTGIACNGDNLLFNNGGERIRINSDGALVFKKGNPLYAESGRVVNFTVSSSYANALNFATLGGANQATGMYLVTIMRTGASVGSHWVGLIAVSTASSAIIYQVIKASSINAQMSGSWLQLQKTTGDVGVHITAVPIGITGYDS